MSDEFVGRIVFVIFFSLIFGLTPLKKIRWQSYLAFFIIASLADVVTTLFGGHLKGWHHEKNIIIQFLGPYLGFDVATIIHSLVFVGPLYVSGKISEKYMEDNLIIGQIIFLFSIERFVAAIFNTLFVLR